MEKEIFLAEFGKRVKQLRHLKGWTQKDLATRCGYKASSSNSTINKIESGKLDVTISKLMELAAVFGVSASYLIGEGKLEEEKNIARENAMQIMDKRLTSSEKKELMRGLEIYFKQNGEEN